MDEEHFIPCESHYFMKNHKYLGCKNILLDSIYYVRGFD
jgi:hypothetical protein